MVDTWAWLAINHEGDQDHEVAKLANEELLEKDYIYVTTNFILAETYTLLRRKVYPQRAVEFGREIQEVIEAEAMELVRIRPIPGKPPVPVLSESGRCPGVRPVARGWLLRGGWTRSVGSAGPPSGPGRPRR
jgi:hypothetical protein